MPRPQLRTSTCDFKRQKVINTTSNANTRGWSGHECVRESVPENANGAPWREGPKSLEDSNLFLANVTTYLLLSNCSVPLVDHLLNEAPQEAGVWNANSNLSPRRAKPFVCCLLSVVEKRISTPDKTYGAKISKAETARHPQLQQSWPGL